MAGNKVAARVGIVLSLVSAIAGGGWLAQSREPGAAPREQGGPAARSPRKLPNPALPNLTLVKEKLIAYHDCHCDCGCYEDDLEWTGRDALAYLERYVDSHRPGGAASGRDPKPALVLDIDETALANWENIRRTDFGFSHDEYVAWEKEAKAAPIRPVLELFQFAASHGVATFFITGRPEGEREWTVKDLEAAGYKGWTRLIMRQPDSPKLAADFKSAERKKLKASGFTIVENIGDQESDLAGEPSLRNFKLPNPFYLVR